MHIHWGKRDGCHPREALAAIVYAVLFCLKSMVSYNSSKDHDLRLHNQFFGQWEASNYILIFLCRYRRWDLGRLHAEDWDNRHQTCARKNQSTVKFVCESFQFQFNRIQFSFLKKNETVWGPCFLDNENIYFRRVLVLDTWEEYDLPRRFPY